MQAIGLALLGVTVVNNGGELRSEFRTVTSGDVRPLSPAVRLVFTAETSMADMTEIGRYHLEVVGGFRGAGVFTAALTSGSSAISADMIAAILRRNPHVQFAEPVSQ